MKARLVLTRAIQVVLLTIVAFVLFSIGSSVFGLRALASQLSPEEAGQSALALLVVCLIDTLLATYLILRSRLGGLPLVVTVAAVLYGIKTFQPQLDYLYFVKSASTDLLPRLFLLTTPLALLFSPIAVVLLGKGRAPRGMEGNTGMRPATGRVWKILFLSVILYPVLLFGFGYFVAWQSPDVRAFYGGTDPGNAFAFFANSFGQDPLQYPFEALRGLLWVGLAMLVMRCVPGSRWETALLVGLLFALIENDQLLIPNPLMPAAVRAVHFVETASENFIFGLATTMVLLWQPAESAKARVSRASM